MSNTYKVAGMTCDGCVKAITNAIKAEAPGATVNVDLDAGLVSIDGVDDSSVIATAVDDAGFEFGGPAN